VIVPGGNPVTDTPGLLSATFPITLVGPALVTVEPPKTATFSAAPSEMVVCAAADRELASSTETINTTAYAAADLRAWFFSAERFCILQTQQRGCNTWARRVRNFAGEQYAKPLRGAGLTMSS
jgi:hypothetical protein